jgi:Flp pilus assembly protein TadG
MYLATSRRSPNRRWHRGVAAVELAICLPVLALLVFGAIEATAFIFLKQSLHVAAYEGARSGSRIAGNQAEATARARAILDSRDVRGATITFISGDVESTERGQPIIIEVAAPTNVNSPLAGQWVANRTLTSRVFMLKE